MRGTGEVGGILGIWEFWICSRRSRRFGWSMTVSESEFTFALALRFGGKSGKDA